MTFFNVMIRPECKQNNIKLKELVNKKKGLASYFIIYCDCGYENPFYTKQNGNSFEVNKYVIYSMHACGQGYAGLDKFNFGMNLPKPMTCASYNKMLYTIRDVCKETAIETNEAAHDF